MSSSNILFRGALTKEKLKSLCQINFGLQGDDHLFNPAKNHEAISIIKQSDGNFVGSAWKHEKVVTAREMTPEHVLQRLLTHE